MKKTRTHVTAKEIQKMHALFAKGLGPTAISRKLKRSVPCVRMHLADTEGPVKAERITVDLRKGRADGSAIERAVTTIIRSELTREQKLSILDLLV